MNDETVEVRLTRSELGLVMFAARQIAKKKEKEAANVERPAHLREAATMYADELRSALRKMKKARGLDPDHPDDDL